MGLVQIVFLAKMTKWRQLLFLQSYCDDPDLVLDLKNLIVLFADTLQVFILIYHLFTVQFIEVLLFFLFRCQKEYTSPETFRNEQLPVSQSRLYFLTGTLKNGEINIRWWTSVCLCSTVRLNNPGWVEADGWGDGGDVGANRTAERL